MIYSSSAVFGYHHHHDSLFFLKRQLLFLAVGFLLMIFASLVDPFWIKRNAMLLVLLGIVLLSLVYFPVIGRTGGGAKRWVQLGFFNFQPAEFVKIALTLYLADYLARKYTLIQKGGWKVFVPPLAVFGIFSAMVIAQPDLGSVIMFFLITMALFFVAGIRFRYILSLFLIALPLVVLLVVLFPYRMARVTSFLDPWNDPRGSGFQIIQSFISFGLGGWRGVGLGESTQKLFYLPQSFTDFIFSIIGEELGLIGALSVILLYIVLLVLGFKVAAKSKDLFLILFSRGLILLVILQAFINILVTTGIIPTKGLPLPFISYGGSSLVTNFIIIGLILGMDRKLNRMKRKKR